jgi:DNA-binding MarR family transcriptional regulator
MNEANDNLKSLEAVPASSSPSLPELPERLLSLFLVQSNDNRRLFMRVFRWLWSYLNNRRVNLGSSYWAVNLVRLRSSLPPSELAYLSYLYQVSNKGVNIVRSDDLYNSGILPGLTDLSKSGVTNRLKRKGFISRHTSDPSAPYLSRSYDRHPIFIKLTGKGIKFIEDLNRDVNNIMMRQSLADLTGKQ